MQTFILMRYSYFGRSDWRSPAAADPDLLFDPARLDKRAALMETVALRSLADQEDPDFGVIVLSSEAMPETEKARLRQMCGDALGDRAHVIFEPQGRAADCIDRYRRGTLPATGEHVIQTILDDDDGLGAGFVARIKLEAQAAVSLFHPEQKYTFISHAKGVNLIFREDGKVELRRRNNPATALGLALVSRAAANRSPFNIAHKKIVERRPVRVIHGGPAMNIRSVHDTNDSRAQYGGDLIGREAAEALIAREFPLLAQFRDRLVFGEQTAV